jgi:hypothetical protein
LVPNFRFASLCIATLTFGAVWMAAETPSTPANPYAIPEGTTMLVRLGQRLETSTARQGNRFKASLAEDVIAPNGSRLERGSRIRGHISRVNQGLHPRLLLSFDDIETSRGRLPLIASVSGVPGEHGVSQPDPDGSIEAASRPSPTSDEPRSPWSRIGAVASLFADHSVRLEKGTIVEVRLDRELQIPRR